MKIQDVLKIVDIDSKELSEDFVKWLEYEIEPTYRDRDFKEHIYNAEDIIDNQNEAETPMYLELLEEIEKHIVENEAGYFRITFDRY